MIRARFAVDVECVEFTIEKFDEIKKWVEGNDSGFTLEHYKPWKYNNCFHLFDSYGYFKDIDINEGIFFIVKFDKNLFRVLSEDQMHNGILTM